MALPIYLSDLYQRRSRVLVVHDHVRTRSAFSASGFTRCGPLFHFYYLPSLIFSYTLAFPANIFLGRLSPAEIVFGFAMQCAWLAAGFVISAALWRGGVKR